MASQSLRWVGTRPKRAPQVPDELWELHKQELEQLYRTKTLDETMEHMATQRGCSPSKRQYVSQFQRWQFQKYSRPASSWLEAKEPVDAASNVAPLVSKDCDRMEEDSPPLSAEPESGYKRKRSPSILSEGSQKLLEYLGQVKHKRPTLTISTSDVYETHRSSDSITNAASNTNSLEWVDVGSAGHPDDTSNYNDMDRLRIRASDATTTWSQRTNHTSSNRDSSDRISSTLSNGMSTSSQRVAASSRSSVGSPLPDVLEVFTPLINLDVPDALDVVNRLTQYEAQRILNAADFLAALYCHDDAFQLYFLLVQRSRLQSDLEDWLVESALIGCARNTVNNAQTVIAQSILNHQLEDMRSKASADIQRLFYFVPLMKLEEAGGHSSDAFRKSTLHRRLRLTRESLKAESSLQRRFFLEVGSFYSGNICPKMSSAALGTIGDLVRQSLKWCLDALKQIVTSESTIRRDLASVSGIKENTLHPYFSHFLVWYCDLFAIYMQQTLAPATHKCPIEAVSQLAMSPALFLANICVMLFTSFARSANYLCYKPRFEALTPQYAQDLQSLLVQDPADIVKRCIELSCEPDPLKLGSMFIHAHYYAQRGLTELSDLKYLSHELCLWPLIERQVEKVLQIKLAGLPTLENLIQQWDKLCQSEQVLKAIRATEAAEEAAQAAEAARIAQAAEAAEAAAAAEAEAVQAAQAAEVARRIELTEAMVEAARAAEDARVARIVRAAEAARARAACAAEAVQAAEAAEAARAEAARAAEAPEAAEAAEATPAAQAPQVDYAHLMPPIPSAQLDPQGHLDPAGPQGWAPPTPQRWAPCSQAGTASPFFGTHAPTMASPLQSPDYSAFRVMKLQISMNLKFRSNGLGKFFSSHQSSHSSHSNNYRSLADVGSVTTDMSSLGIAELE